MSNINGNIPSIKNSKLIGQSEIQNVKQNMSSTTGQNMILGAELTSNTSNVASQGNMTNFVPSLNSSTSVGSGELQNVKQNMNLNSSSQENMTMSVPSLNSSTSVGSGELQNVKQNMNLNSSSNQGNMSMSVPSLNSSITVDSQELSNVKNKVQKSGYNKRSF